MTYDARGKLLTVATPDGSFANFYTGLGALRGTYNTRNSLTLSEERYRLDALGNRYGSVQSVNHGVDGLGNAPLGFRYTTAPDSSTWAFEASTGRSFISRGVSSSDSASFDRAGNRTQAWSNRIVGTPYTGTCHETNWLLMPLGCSSSDIEATLVEGSFQYYGADGKLRISDRRTCLVFGDVAQPTHGASRCCESAVHAHHRARPSYRCSTGSSRPD
jgi:hypothetical protein